MAVIGAALCGALFAFQRSLIYFPQPRSNQTASNLVALETPAGKALVSVRPSSAPGALIYFGGNAEDVSQAMPEFAAAFPDRAIYLLHYPGYGGSPGTPSEKVIFSQSLALYDQVRTEHDNIIVIGRSLGSGVAVHLASLRPVARLVLVTPYNSLQEIASQHYPYFPVRWLLRDKFESWKYAPQVTAPTRIIVAAHDEIIPRASSERLRTHFKDGIASYAVIPNVGHNNISDSPDYLPLLKRQ